VVIHHAEILSIGQQAGIIPNLDSIAEFRIITSNADAEYGNYSGGLIDVVTKSGGNHAQFFGNGSVDGNVNSPALDTFSTLLHDALFNWGRNSP
jgi:hypothetical protein